MSEKASAHLIRWAMGGVLYGLLEILWRGHTHWTMMLLAAILCIPLDIANEHIPWEFPLWLQAVLGGTAITAAELAAGLVLNVWLGLDVWDYSGVPGNIMGQVCPQFMFAWAALSAVAVWVEDRLHKIFD